MPEKEVAGMASNDTNKTDKARKRKEGTLVSAYIEQSAYDALARHCEITGQSKTKAIERAILSYCGENDGHDKDA